MTILCIEGLEGGVAGPFWLASSGTLSFQTAIKRSGSYALRTNPTTTGDGSVQFGGLAATGVADATSGFNKDTIYCSFYFYAATLPAANNEEFFNIDTVGSFLFRLRVDSTGAISAYGDDVVLITTGAAGTIVTGTWYKIEVKITKGSSGTFVVRVDGVTNISGTLDGTQIGTNNFRKIILGKRQNRNGQSVDFYYDDLVVDDADYPSTGRVLLQSVNADGSTQQWTAGTNASNWQEVDEIPPDAGTTYVKCGLTGTDVALFKVSSSTAAGVESNILAAVPTVYIAEDITVVSANSFRARSGGNNYDSSTLDHTTTYASRAALYVTDPATSASWTRSALDAIEFGSIETSLFSMRLDAAFMQVLSVPGSVSEAYGLGLPFTFDQRVIGLIP